MSESRWSPPNNIWNTGSPPLTNEQIDQALTNLTLSNLNITSPPNEPTDAVTKEYLDTQLSAQQVNVDNSTIEVVNDALQVKAGGIGHTHLKLYQDFGFTSTTPSASPTSGAITTAGGLGVGGDVNVAGRVLLKTNTTPTVPNELTSKTYVDSQISGVVAGQVSPLSAGAGITIENNTASVKVDNTTIAIDSGTNSLGVKDASITSAKLATLTGLTSSGDLVMTGSSARIKLNGTRQIWLASAEGDGAGDMHIWDNTNSRRVFGYYATLNLINVGSTAGTVATRITGNQASTSKTSGALQVNGGAGIAGDLYATNINASGTLTGTLSTGSQPNITSIGTLGSLTVSGALTTGSLTVSGALNGTLSTALQPNITKTGILSSLEVSGLAVVTDPTQSSSPLNGAFCVAGGVGIGKDLQVGGTVYAPSVYVNAVWGQIMHASQPSITSLGTLTSLDVTGAVTAGSFVGTLSTASQPNITSIGTLGSLTVSGSIAGTLSTASQPNITSVGTLNGLTSSGIVNITNNTLSTTNSVGALVVNGDIGCKSAIYSNAFNVNDNTGNRYGFKHISGNFATGVTIDNWTAGAVGSRLNIGSSTAVGAYKSELHIFAQSINSVGGQEKLIISADGTRAEMWWSTSSTAKPLLVYGNTQFNIDGTISVQSNAVSSSTTTGALKVTGGVGIGGALFGTTATFSGAVSGITPTSGAHFTTKSYVDTAVSAGQNPANVLSITNTTDADAPSTGSIQTLGGIYVAKKSYHNDDITLQRTITGTASINILNNGTGVDATATNASQIFFNPFNMSGSTNTGSYLVARKVSSVYRLEARHHNDTSGTNQLYWALDRGNMVVSKDLVPDYSGTVPSCGTSSAPWTTVQGKTIIARNNGTTPQMQVIANTTGAESSIGFFKNTDASQTASGDVWVVGHNVGNQGAGHFGIYANTLGLAMTVHGTTGVVHATKGHQVGGGTVTTKMYHLLWNGGTSAGNAKEVTVTYGFTLPPSNDYRCLVSCENTSMGGGVLACSITSKSSTGCKVQIMRVDGGAGGFGGGAGTGWTGDCWISILIVQP